MGEAEDKTSSTFVQRVSSGRLHAGATIMNPRFWKPDLKADDGPGLVLASVLVGTFLLEMVSGGPIAWGVSSQALREGRWHTLAAHMVAHGGIVHLLMNLGALLALSPVVISRLGNGPAGWVRYGALLVCSGLLGATAYLVLHLDGTIPLIGASGAICGLWGFAARVEADGSFAPLFSKRAGQSTWAFAKANLILFLLFFVVMWGTGTGSGLAWEAHLGGFLFGLLVGPVWGPSTLPIAPFHEGDTDTADRP